MNILVTDGLFFIINIQSFGLRASLLLSLLYFLLGFWTEDSSFISSSDVASDTEIIPGESSDSFPPETAHNYFFNHDL